jgi:hypothetical protein
LQPNNLTQILLGKPSLLEDYRARKRTAASIAEEFGYRENYVLATLSRMGVKRPLNPDSTYRVQQKQALLASTRREFREFLAQKVVKSALSIEKAAEMACCSERTMRRYVDKVKNSASQG